MASVSGQFEIVNEKGLHARAATVLVKVAMTFDSSITVRRGAMSANGKSIMNLLILAAPRGSTIEVEAIGDDAAAALEAIGAVIKDGFGE